MTGQLSTGLASKRVGEQKSSPAAKDRANRKIVAHTNYEIPASVSTDEIRALPVKTLQACPEGQINDAAFFAENPGRAFRLRPALAGEVLVDHGAIGLCYVIARRVAQRLVLRRPVLVGGCCARAFADADDAVGAAAWQFWDRAFAANAGPSSLRWSAIVGGQP